jgi:hypothetical protein
MRRAGSAAGTRRTPVWRTSSVTQGDIHGVSRPQMLDRSPSTHTANWNACSAKWPTWNRSPSAATVPRAVARSAASCRPGARAMAASGAANIPANEPDILDSEIIRASMVDAAADVHRTSRSRFLRGGDNEPIRITRESRCTRLKCLVACDGVGTRTVRAPQRPLIARRSYASLLRPISALELAPE